MNWNEDFFTHPHDNIGNHTGSHTFPIIGDIFNSLNTLIEFGFINNYDLSILSKADRDISNVIHFKVDINNKYEVFQFNKNEYYIEIDTKNESKEILDSMKREYIKLWKERGFEIYKGNFLSLENQKLEVNAYIQKTHEDFQDTVITVSESDIGKTIQFDEFLDINIDLLGVLLFLEGEKHIEIEDIFINKKIDFRINIKENKLSKFIGEAIELNYAQKFVIINKKKIDLNILKKQHIFILILLDKFKQECDLGFIETQFKEVYKIVLKKENRLIKDQINEIYRNIGKNKSSLKDLHKYISKTESNRYKLG